MNYKFNRVSVTDWTKYRKESVSMKTDYSSLARGKKGGRKILWNLWTPSRKIIYVSLEPQEEKRELI